MMNVKPWYKSKTVISGLIVVATSLSGIALNIDPASGEFSGNIYVLATQIAGAFGGAGGIFGRLKARQKIA